MQLTTAPLVHIDHFPRTVPLAKRDDPHRIFGEEVTLGPPPVFCGDTRTLGGHAQYGNAEVPLENDVACLQHCRLLSTQNLLPPGLLELVGVLVGAEGGGVDRNGKRPDKARKAGEKLASSN